MARNTESDGTYCSEVEKEDRYQIRRSKRLSQRKSLLSSFRSNVDPTQRLYEIHQMLKCDEICLKWSIDDWESLKIEVESIKQISKGKQKGRISFILKKINQKLQKTNLICPNGTPSIIQPNQNDEQVKSPNILAGMMTEFSTEIPPYQPENLPEITNTVKISDTSIAVTQKNPLDLTKKNLGVQVVLEEVLPQNIPEKQKPQPIRAVPSNQQREEKRHTTTTELCVSKDSMIDLTEENTNETNRENVVPVMKEMTSKSKSRVHVSKWLQFLPTQQRPTFTEKQANVTTNTTIAPKKTSKTLKDSIVKLYKDQPPATASISNKIQAPLSTSGPKKPEYIQKSKSPSIRPNENLRKKAFQNSENLTTREHIIPRVSPRNVQSEPFGNISPDFLFDELLDLSESDMNDSVTSLTLSLKEDFRKVFGTDKLKDVFLGDEVIYKLKENHVRCLATALKIEHATLKKTIENILANDNHGLVQDDVIQSDSSVVECSQSPPHRLFPSQRSQT